MAISSPDSVQTRYAEWQLGDLAVEVPYAATDEQAELLLTTGFGERDVSGIARGLGERGLSVVVTRTGYPEDIKLTDEVMELAIVESHGAVIAGMNQMAGRPEDSPVVGVSNSKGAGEQMKAAAERPGLWRRVVPVAPMGLTNQSLEGNFRDQRRELINRIQESGLTAIQPDEDADTRGLRREFMSGIQYAFNHDGLPVAVNLHKAGLLDRILVGQEDGVFRPTEFVAALGPVGLAGLVEPVRGVGHISLNTEAGLDHMAAIIQSHVPEAASEKLAA